MAASMMEQGGTVIMEKASTLPNVSSNFVTDHLYYPLEVEIAGLIANEWSVEVLLTLFFGTCALVFVGTMGVVNKVHPNLKGGEKAAIWWFVLSGLIHLFFEGYFSLNHFQMGPAQDILGQLWKEYAFSDSRYLTSDPFVLCMETVTAFTWGPICLLLPFLIVKSHPLRHPLQIIVCVGQIYGLILYYATSMFDHYYTGVTYSRPEFLYFWFYYFFMNFIWMVFPGILLVSSVRTIAKAFNALDELNASKKQNGMVNGKKHN
jgi:cholestenol delta-isomerase